LLFLLVRKERESRPFCLRHYLTSAGRIYSHRCSLFACLLIDIYFCSLLVVVVSVYRFLLIVLSVSFVRMLPGFFYRMGKIGAVVDSQISQSFIEVVRNVSTMCISFL
jgi:hypothetical protein